MTTFFLITCAVSVIFFAIFLYEYSLPRKKSTRVPVVRRAPESQAVDCPVGRRFFVHLEKEMADFVALHGRTAAVLVLACVLVPLTARAQGPDADSPDTKSRDTGSQDASGNAQQIPLAVQQQLDAMQKRIEQLEQQLQSRQTQSGDDGTAATPTHALSDQSSGSVPAAGVSAENSLAKNTKPAKPEPFSFADFTWLNGNNRVKEVPFQTKFFTPEIRTDVSYIYDFAHPQDDTIGGSAEVFRANEFQLTMLGVGGTFNYDNVIARVMTQVGMYSQTQPRNDASPGRGQWQLADAYRYLSEAYGGYHFNVLDGVNVEAGIFLSYIGLFSWYNFDNWAYQPSYVSSNTPFFFNGMRVQVFPTDKLKVEGWLINGWQSYGRFNGRPGLGSKG